MRRRADTLVEMGLRGQAKTERRDATRLARVVVAEPTLQWFEGYELRRGGDGKMGIYLREYDVRLAVFNANTAELQSRLKLLFARANAPVPGKPKRKKRRASWRDHGIGTPG